MGRYSYKYGKDLESYVTNNHREKTVSEMAKERKVSTAIIYYYLHKNLLKAKSPRHNWVAKGRVISKREVKPEPKPKESNRPPAQYTNLPSPYGLADELYGRNLVRSSSSFC